MAMIGVSELRARLREALDRARRGEELWITRNAEVVAVLVHPSRLRRQAATAATRAAEELAEDLGRRRTRPERVPRGELDKDRAEELVEWIRSGRESS